MHRDLYKDDFLENMIDKLKNKEFREDTLLKEQISEDKLRSVLENQPGLAWKQRLGYIFELNGAKNLANIVKNYLSALTRIDYTLLNPNLKKFNKKKKNATWKIIENVKIESDI